NKATLAESSSAPLVSGRTGRATSLQSAPHGVRSCGGPCRSDCGAEGCHPLPWLQEEGPEGAQGHRRRAGRDGGRLAAQGDCDGHRGRRHAHQEAVKEPQGESSEEEKKKPEQEDGAAEKKQPEAESSKEVEKVEAKTDGGDSEGAETKQAKGAAEPAKEAPAAAGAANDEDEAKKSDKAKDAGTAEPAAVTTERSLPLAPAPKHAYEHEYRPPYYVAPAQPVLSYHAAQRSSSVSHFAPQAQPAYSTQQAHPHQAYYSAQPQPGKQWSPSYLYMPYPHAAAPEPYYQQDYYGPPGMHASPMHDSSYRIFDDENPNSCSVM
uniref:Uncharacterized protein n=1 Tax=Zea mays TaxID=4577 RepID=A0A804R951_MAIZE